MIEILNFLRKMKAVPQVEYLTIYDKKGYCILKGLPKDCYSNVMSIYDKDILMVVLNLESGKVRILKNIQRMRIEESNYRI